MSKIDKIRYNGTDYDVGGDTPSLEGYATEEYVDNKIDNIQTLPSGGTTGQVLAKKSNNDGDVEWINVSGGQPLDVYSTSEQVVGTWINRKAYL